MDFLVWVLVALFFFVYATVVLIKASRKKEPFLKSLKDWVIKVIDILSGGG